MEKSKIDLKNKLVSELSYEFMKAMTREQYFIFAKGIFKLLIPYKSNGLTKDDMFNIIDPDIYYGQYLMMDSDEIFGIRLEILLNELISYCGMPTFWETDFSIYIKKWDTYYNSMSIL